MKIGTKTQFGTLLIVAALVYVFWVDIVIGGLSLYANYFETPVVEKLLGEYYAAQANDYSEKAAKYYQEALISYKIALPGTREEQRKWLEYIIGNHYECGKGVDKDLEKAKYWYKRAVANGLAKNKNVCLQSLQSALVDIHMAKKAAKKLHKERTAF